MKDKSDKRSGKRNWITVLAVCLMLAGVLAFAVPLIWQRINYSIASKNAAEAESQMIIPGRDDYKTVDYSTMKEAENPIYTKEEKEDASNPPGLLEELGIVGEPSGMLFAMPSAKAESAEPSSMREALNQGAKALKDGVHAPYNHDIALQAIDAARRQVENAFFLLTQIQPMTDTESIASLSNQKVVDSLTLGDKTITAAREMIYNTLTDLEELLKQVEDEALSVRNNGSVTDQMHLLAQMETLSSYLSMAALHLPDDDYAAAMAQQQELAGMKATGNQGGDTSSTGGEGTSGNNSGTPSGQEDDDQVKRTYLLEIPDIKLKVAVLRSGTFNSMYKNMRSGAAMFPRAPEPDTSGNISISAHRTGTRDFFRNLNKLSEGDMVYLHTSHLGSFQYEVVQVSIIANNDWSVTGSAGYPALTLLSCQAYGGVSNAQRIMVRAKLVGVANGQ